MCACIRIMAKNKLCTSNPTPHARIGGLAQIHIFCTLILCRMAFAGVHINQLSLCACKLTSASLKLRLYLMDIHEIQSHGPRYVAFKKGSPKLCKLPKRFTVVKTHSPNQFKPLTLWWSKHILRISASLLHALM